MQKYTNEKKHDFMRKGIMQAPCAGKPIKLYCENSQKETEVKTMKELKGWPFEPLDGDVEPCGGVGPGPLPKPG